jgi:hypothetical protein
LIARSNILAETDTMKSMVCQYSKLDSAIFLTEENCTFGQTAVFRAISETLFPFPL